MQLRWPARGWSYPWIRLSIDCRSKTAHAGPAVLKYRNNSRRPAAFICYHINWSFPRHSGGSPTLEFTVWLAQSGANKFDSGRCGFLASLANGNYDVMQLYSICTLYPAGTDLVDICNVYIYPYNLWLSCVFWRLVDVRVPFWRRSKLKK